MNIRFPRPLAPTGFLALTLPLGAQAIVAPEAEPATLVFGDYDADGLDDVVALAAGKPVRLLHNLGDGRYEEAARLVGLGHVQDASFALWSDYDGDGRVDLLLGAAVGPRHLFRNVEGGAFVEVAAELGLAGQGGDRSARWLDADGDGRLDLHVEGAAGGRLYRALADGTFEETLISTGKTKVLGGWIGDVSEAGTASPTDDANDSPKGSKTRGTTTIDGTRTVVLSPDDPSVAFGPGGASAGGATPILGFPAGCATSIRDQAAPASCLQASSVPTLGLLFPMSSDLFVDSTTGDVGMGTTTPVLPLTVSSEAGGLGQWNENENIVVGSYAALSAGWYGTFTNHPLSFFVNNGLAEMTIDTAGNVGIGTDTPSTNLNVVTDGMTDGIHVDNPVDASKIILAAPSPTAGFTGGVGTSTAHDMPLFTSNVDRMTIKADGKIGVGTASPTAAFDAVSSTLTPVLGRYTGGGTTPGVRGETNATGGGTQTNAPTGVLGVVNGTNGGSWSAGVRGINNSNQFPGVGVLGITNGTGAGVYGESAGGRSLEGAGQLVNFGNATITGTLSKGAGSFKIDHPLDPANKYLYHSFVESPDMMNIYNGNVVTDADGRAVIEMPDWFEVLNRDFRYQLTVIGSFAQAMVEKKMEDGRFAIRTSKPGVEVSWQVTGIRHDPFAEAHRIPVEEQKPADERGRYLHPDLYGAPRSQQAPRPSGPFLDAAPAPADGGTVSQG